MTTDHENDGYETLGNTELRAFYFACRCGRTGRYHRQTLLDQFGPDITLVGGDLAREVACWRGCPQATWDRDHDWATTGVRCGVHYDIVKMRP